MPVRRIGFESGLVKDVRDWGITLAEFSGLGRDEGREYEMCGRLSVH